MGLCDDVRAACAEIAASTDLVEIDRGALAALELPSGGVGDGDLDPEIHYVEGSREDVALFVVMLDAINFGSGWFPTLVKAPGRSGYETVAAGLAGRFRDEGPWAVKELESISAGELAEVFGQPADHPLIALFSRALSELGVLLERLPPLELIEGADASAERFAEILAAELPLFDDPGFYKRAQITPSDLARAGVAEFHDLDRLTIFADNVVPHVLRVDGVLRYDPALAARVDAEDLIPPRSPEEQAIRACAVHACELISAERGIAPRDLDAILWNRGRGELYKSRPRHRTRTTDY